MIKLQLFLV